MSMLELVGRERCFSFKKLGPGRAAHDLEELKVRWLKWRAVRRSLRESMQ